MHQTYAQLLPIPLYLAINLLYTRSPPTVINETVQDYVCAGQCCSDNFQAKVRWHNAEIRAVQRSQVKHCAWLHTTRGGKSTSVDLCGTLKS